MKKLLLALVILTCFAIPAFATNTYNVQISPDIGGTISVGDTAEFDVTRDGVAYPGITWETSDPSVASITEDGILTALAAGNVTVFATAEDGFSTTWEVQVQGQSGYIAPIAKALCVVAFIAIGAIVIKINKRGEMSNGKRKS